MSFQCKNIKEYKNNLNKQMFGSFNQTNVNLNNAESINFSKNSKSNKHCYTSTAEIKHCTNNSLNNNNNNSDFSYSYLTEGNLFKNIFSSKAGSALKMLKKRIDFKSKLNLNENLFNTLRTNTNNNNTTKYITSKNLNTFNSYKFNSNNLNNKLNMFNNNIINNSINEKINNFKNNSIDVVDNNNLTTNNQIGFNNIRISSINNKKLNYKFYNSNSNLIKSKDLFNTKITNKSKYSNITYKTNNNNINNYCPYCEHCCAINNKKLPYLLKSNNNLNSLRNESYNNNNNDNMIDTNIFVTENSCNTRHVDNKYNNNNKQNDLNKVFKTNKYFKDYFELNNSVKNIINKAVKYIVNLSNKPDFSIFKDKNNNENILKNFPKADYSNRLQYEAISRFLLSISENKINLEEFLYNENYNKYNDFLSHGLGYGYELKSKSNIKKHKPKKACKTLSNKIKTNKKFNKSIKNNKNKKYKFISNYKKEINLTDKKGCFSPSKVNKLIYDEQNKYKYNSHTIKSTLNNILNKYKFKYDSEIEELLDLETKKNIKTILIQPKIKKQLLKELSKTIKLLDTNTLLTNKRKKAFTYYLIFMQILSDISNECKERAYLLYTFFKVYFAEQENKFGIIISNIYEKVMFYKDLCKLILQQKHRHIENIDYITDILVSQRISSNNLNNHKKLIKDMLQLINEKREEIYLLNSDKEMLQKELNLYLFDFERLKLDKDVRARMKDFNITNKKTNILKNIKEELKHKKYSPIQEILLVNSDIYLLLSGQRNYFYEQKQYYINEIDNLKANYIKVSDEKTELGYKLNSLLKENGLTLDRLNNEILNYKSLLGVNQQSNYTQTDIDLYQFNAMKKNHDNAMYANKVKRSNCLIREYIDNVIYKTSKISCISLTSLKNLIIEVYESKLSNDYNSDIKKQQRLYFDEFFEYFMKKRYKLNNIVKEYCEKTILSLIEYSVKDNQVNLFKHFLCVGDDNINIRRQVLDIYLIVLNSLPVKIKTIVNEDLEVLSVNIDNVVDFLYNEFNHIYLLNDIQNNLIDKSNIKGNFDYLNSNKNNIFNIENTKSLLSKTKDDSKKNRKQVKHSTIDFNASISNKHKCTNKKFTSVLSLKSKFNTNKTLFYCLLIRFYKRSFRLINKLKEEKKKRIIKRNEIIKKIEHKKKEYNLYLSSNNKYIEESFEALDNKIKHHTYLEENDNNSFHNKIKADITNEITSLEFDLKFINKYGKSFVNYELYNENNYKDDLYDVIDKESDLILNLQDIYNDFELINKCLIFNKEDIILDIINEYGYYNKQLNLKHYNIKNNCSIILINYTIIENDIKNNYNLIKIKLSEYLHIIIDHLLIKYNNLEKVIVNIFEYFDTKKHGMMSLIRFEKIVKTILNFNNINNWRITDYFMYTSSVINKEFITQEEFINYCLDYKPIISSLLKKDFKFNYDNVLNT